MALVLSRELQAFCQAGVKKMLIFVKFFQKFVWRFSGISRGYGPKICFLRDSRFAKFFAPASRAIEIHGCSFPRRKATSARANEHDF
jgi:hypothetical protein